MTRFEIQRVTQKQEKQATTYEGIASFSGLEFFSKQSVVGIIHPKTQSAAYNSLLTFLWNPPHA
jgi:hypothetical protein